MRLENKFWGYRFIPLSAYSTLSVGDTVDLKTAKLISLCKEGENDILRIVEQ